MTDLLATYRAMKPAEQATGGEVRAPHHLELPIPLSRVLVGVPNGPTLSSRAPLCPSP